jgi:WD40 repeat protein
MNTKDGQLKYRGTRSCGGLLPILALIGAVSAVAVEPTTDPLLRLETGTHTAKIGQVATDAQGRWAVTASYDKTARVWDLESGKQLTVLRPPQGAGEEGMLYAVAMSPDGTTAAVGGWTGPTGDDVYSIYLFDRATGHLTRRIAGLPDVVFHLAFSPDGRRLLASVGGGEGIRMFNVISGKEVARDVEYRGKSYSADFRYDGRRLVTAAFDGYVRLYAVEDESLKLLKRTKPEGGRQPFSARFSPDGRSIAVGFNEKTSVEVLSATTLERTARPTSKGVDNGDLACVTWSSDGLYLFAGGAWDVDQRTQVRRWRVGDWSHHKDVSVAEQTVQYLAPLPDGRVVFVTSDPIWGILGSDGAVQRSVAGKTLDFANHSDQLRVSADGRRVRFGYRWGGKDPCVFDLPAGNLGADDPGLPAARTKAPGIKVEQWDTAYKPKLNGKLLALNNDEISRGLAIAPDARRFVLGTGWLLRLFERNGAEVWNKPVPGTAWAVTISGDGRFVVAAYGDGTIRWHKISDGAEVLAFFPHSDRKQWIAWTPEGYFNASPGAEELVGYHLNRGTDREGEFVSARQLRETFFQPGLIAGRLNKDGDERMAEAIKKRGDIRKLLDAGETPELELVSPAKAETDGTYSLEVRLKNAGRGAGRLVLRVDGQDLSSRWQAPALTPGGVVKIPVEPSAGLHKVSAEWVDSRGVGSKPVEASVNVRERVAAMGSTLHVLAVGITDYFDSALKLKYAATDALEIVKEFEARGSSLFGGRVKMKTLVDKQANAALIESTLLNMAKLAGPEDTFVLFMAGHGTVLDEEYYFMPHELVYENDEALRKQGISQAKIREWMTHLPARSLLLLDTCRAGGMVAQASRGAEDKNAVSKLIRLSQRSVIVATSASNIALEGYKGHGVFTWAVLDALKNADYDKNGKVDVTDIATHVKKLVPEITEEVFKIRQVPMQDTPGEPFSLALPLKP